MKTIQYKDKTITFVATAHVSAQSVEDVRQAIEMLKPDAVCIELDAGRARSLMNESSYKNIDIKQIIKNKQTFSFLANLLLSSYQKKLADDLNTEVGGEMKQAIRSAQEIDARIHYIDRDIQITMKRIWGNLTFFRKISLASTLIASMFESDDIEATDIEALKNSDLLYESMKEMDEKLPEISEKILHERNYYMAEKLKRILQSTIVCVIGAAHEQGIIEALEQEHSLRDLNTLPPKKKSIAGWIVPVSLVLGLVILTYRNPETGLNQLWLWLGLCSGLSALGGVIALAHPLTILTAVVGAPIGILSPFLAVGIFTGLMEAYQRPPRVSDFEALTQDILSLKSWYQNRVLRILLVALLTNILSSVGTFIAGGSVLSSLFQ